VEPDERHHVQRAVRSRGQRRAGLWCLAIVAVAMACVCLCSPARRRRQAARAAQNKDILHQMSLPLEPEDDDNPKRRG
jgi:hypothetical protein